MQERVNAIKIITLWLMTYNLKVHKRLDFVTFDQYFTTTFQKLLVLVIHICQILGIQKYCKREMLKYIQDVQKYCIYNLFNHLKLVMFHGEHSIKIIFDINFAEIVVNLWCIFSSQAAEFNCASHTEWIQDKLLEILLSRFPVELPDIVILWILLSHAKYMP